MDNKTYNGSVPPYQANPSHPPPGPGGMVSPNHTGSYETSPPAVTQHDSYNQGPPPAHPPPGSSPTQYPHQPIPPLSSPPTYASQPPAGSPPPQISHAPPPPAAMASPPQEKHEYFNAGAGAGGAPQQAGIPMQNHPGMPATQPSGGYAAPTTNVYHTATPLASLNMAPAPVDCPVCHTRTLTRTEQHSGNTTHAWAALVCLFTGCGCIPYLIRGLKDTEHYCGHCGVLLATYHNSGHTVVYQHA